MPMHTPYNNYAVDAAYEGMQKLLFVSTITVAILFVPFLLELLLLRHQNIDSPNNKEDKTGGPEDTTAMLEGLDNDKINK